MNIPSSTIATPRCWDSGKPLQRPYSAWLLRNSGFFPSKWVLPVLEFLWNDPEVLPRDPALAEPAELPRQRFFSRRGHLVMRSGWKPDSTWIEFDCGAYFSKHQHLSQNHFSIITAAIWLSTAERTTPIPRAHITSTITGGRWPTIPSWYMTRARNFSGPTMLWMPPMTAASAWIRRVSGTPCAAWTIGSTPAIFGTWAACGCGLSARLVSLRAGGRDERTPRPNSSASRASYSIFRPQMFCWCSTGWSAPIPIFERYGCCMASTSPSSAARGRPVRMARRILQRRMNSDSVTAEGELQVHCLLPEKRSVTKRGGPGNEFWTPGNERGGEWGSGENWPLEPAEGGPLPDDPRLRRCGRNSGATILKARALNRKNVVPGAWRVEVSPASAGG